MELELDPWQKEIIAYNGHILLNTGRQVGKTLVFSRKAVHYMLDHPACRIIVVSLTDDQAQLMILMMLTYLEKHYKKQICQKSGKRPSRNQIRLTNDSHVIARPVGDTGDAVRGFTGDVLIVDEASRFNEVVWTAVKPTLLTTGGQIWMCSTPFGRRGYYYECYMNKKGRFRIFETNSVKVIKERKISSIWTTARRTEALQHLKDEENEMSTLRFGQEYLGLFLDDLRQYFPDKLIKSCIIPYTRHEPQQDADYYLGVDVARMGEDRSSFQIFMKGPDGTLTQVYNSSTSKTLLTWTAKEVLNLNEKYNFRKILIDTGGMGVGVFDILIENREVRSKIIDMNNLKRAIEYDPRDEGKKGKIAKEVFYENMLVMMQQGRIKLFNDPEIFLSLKSTQYEYTSDDGGVSRIKIFGHNNDIREALIRAAWGAKEKIYKPWIVAI